MHNYSEILHVNKASCTVNCSDVKKMSDTSVITAVAIRYLSDENKSIFIAKDKDNSTQNPSNQL